MSLANHSQSKLQLCSDKLSILQSLLDHLNPSDYSWKESHF